MNILASKCNILIVAVSNLALDLSELVVIIRLEAVCSFWRWFVHFGGVHPFGAGSGRFGDSLIGNHNKIIPGENTSFGSNGNCYQMNLTSCLLRQERLK